MKDVITKAFAIFGLVMLVAVLLTVPIYYLWNWLMPIIFGIGKITLWESLGINILSSLLFKASGK